MGTSRADLVKMFGADRVREAEAKAERPAKATRTPPKAIPVTAEVPGLLTLDGPLGVAYGPIVATVIAWGQATSLNAERGAHWAARARTTKETRQAVAEQLNGVEPVTRFYAAAYPFIAKGQTPDAGNAYPTVKACIDGMVDAGLAPDDTPEFLAGIHMAAPQRIREADGPGIRLAIHKAA